MNTPSALGLGFAPYIACMQMGLKHASSHRGTFSDIEQVDDSNTTMSVAKGNRTEEER